MGVVSNQNPMKVWSPRLSIQTARGPPPHYPYSSMGAEGSSDGQRFQVTPLHMPNTSPTGGFLPEILEELASFLVGYDVLQLSHVCHAFRVTFSSVRVWESRLGPLDGRAEGCSPARSSWCEAQTQYFNSRSLYFRGLAALSSGPKRGRNKLLDSFAKAKFAISGRTKPTLESVCGDACQLPYSLLPTNGRLSFELWFSLTSLASRGGILLGHQSQSCFESDKHPSQYQRIVNVDPDHNLYCSVLASKPIIAHNLEPSRWYHLVLTFDGKRQSVYLDGQLVSSGVGLGNVHEKWHWTPHIQLGTGYIAANSSGKPSPDFAGWYPFEGLIDNFRLWYSVLTLEEIERLARCEKYSTNPVYALSSDRVHLQEGVRRIKCSRPAERRAFINSPRRGQTAPSA